jgi:hypothetical protein
MSAVTVRPSLADLLYSRLSSKSGKAEPERGRNTEVGRDGRPTGRDAKL